MSSQIQSVEIEQPHAPPALQRWRRTGRAYIQLYFWLQEHPPNKIAFTIAQVADALDISQGMAYQVLRQYRMDSKLFLKYECEYLLKTHPELSDEALWNEALASLHKQGRYFISPRLYLDSHWVEPTFYEFETYNATYFGQNARSLAYRITDAIDFSMAIDGINLRDALIEVRELIAMLEGNVGYPCEECGVAFNTPDELQAHRSIDHKERLALPTGTPSSDDS